MRHILDIIGTSIIQALQELRVNKLRTFLSLLGISIGIFCIIAVLTALQSTQNLIKKDVESLGSDILYIGRWPWPGTIEGEFKWWEYWRRPSLTIKECNLVNEQLGTIAFATINLPIGNQTIKRDEMEVNGIKIYAVGQDFDKMQSIEINNGRYLSTSELGGGNNIAILGTEVYEGLFTSGINPIGKYITVLGRKYMVAGTMKKSGQSMDGNDFDNGIIIPYNSITSTVDVSSFQYNPMLMIKAHNAKNLTDVRDEVRGLLRKAHKIRPDKGDDFSVNQLSGIAKMLDGMFAQIKMVGFFIGGFSLLVGAFGIANIMFVTVKERTRIIGLKKAIGARRSSILMEFLLESIVLCVMGGLAGILIVLLLSAIVSKVLDVEVYLSVSNFLFGVFVSIFVGVISGFTPARKASKLDPVVAIRSH